MNVFLDLEETIIQSWYNPTLVNVSSIRTALRDVFDIESVGIFSFAIGNNTDREKFISQFMPMIENALEVRVDLDRIVTCDEMMKNSRELHGCVFESWADYINVVGKGGAFIDHCRLHRVGMNTILIDDCVRNSTTIDHDTVTTIRLLPVQTLDVVLRTAMG